MKSFAVHFQYPWLLLLLIPAFALTFFLYFRLEKKYRRTRNRVISVTLHLIVSVLCTFALAGMEFRYTVANTKNEVILLMDVSDTQAGAEGRRDAFLKSVTEEGSYDGYRMGVVTFGFTQQYAVPLTYDAAGIFERYKSAPLPDTTATDLSAALSYARGLFSEPRSAKIVLVTDGRETDGSALDVIRPITSAGIRVDLVDLGEEDTGDSVQIVGISYPAYHIAAGTEFPVTVTLHAREAVAGAVVRLSDNGIPCAEDLAADLTGGTQSVTFRITFAESGLHELRAAVTAAGDGREENNSYRSYYDLEVFDRVLVLEQAEGDSDSLRNILSAGEGSGSYVLTTVNLKTEPDRVPADLDSLRQYDQIILNNVSNGDLCSLPVPEGGEDDADWFVKLLYSYVRDYGGGLLTSGGYDTGREGAKTAHAYNRADMKDSLLSGMLPVEVMGYTPRMGVMFILDISSSMGGGGEGSALQAAKESAVACLDNLNSRDYIGVMTLDSEYDVVLPLTRATERDTIKEKILSLSGKGNTVFTGAIKRAGEALRQLEPVDLRHIVMVTDGRPTGGAEQSNEDIYIDTARELYEKFGITLSVVGVNMEENGEPAANMQALAEAAGGERYIAKSGTDIKTLTAKDLTVPEVEELEEGTFYPLVSNALSPLLGGVWEPSPEEGGSADRRSLDVPLGGIYGVKSRTAADVVLMGEKEVPVYAQWRFGKGMVGSFLCDLSGKWSKEFLSAVTGQQFVRNAVANLMPMASVRPEEIAAELREDNYTNRLSVYTDLADGESITGYLRDLDTGEEFPLDPAETATDGSVYVTSALGKGSMRCEFVLKKSGVYEIVLFKLDREGTLIAQTELYKAFSYSAEYAPAVEEEGHALLASLAEAGGGALIGEDEPWAVFSGFDPLLDKTFDPLLLFAILSMVCFLLDIVVRKFKFKWIHELVREHKRKKAEGRS